MEILAFDIGGTKVNAGIFTILPDGRLRLEHERRFESRDFRGLGEIALVFAREHADLKPCAVGIGVAGPVTGRLAKVTNLPWIVSAVEVEDDLLPLVGTRPLVVLLNDLAAHAYGLDHVTSEHLHLLDAGAVNAGVKLVGNKALIAPGTGLGEAILFRMSDGAFVPSASEGGHCDFAPYDEFDERYFRFLRRRHPQHVSWERVVSGGEGFANLHRFLVEVDNRQPIATLQGRPERKWGPYVVQAASEGHATASEIVERFCAYLAREAANLALKALSLEGVYFSGGVVSGILPWLKSDSFREAFLAKGRFAELLATMPLYAVTDPICGLKGAAAAAGKSLQVVGMSRS